MARTSGLIAKTEYVGIVQSLQYMVQNEGLKSLWNGNGANVLRVIPNYGLRFMLNDRARDFIMKARGLTPGKHHLSRGDLFLAGALAGTGQITATYPFEVIFTRLAVSGSKAYQGQKYKGILDCFLQTLRAEGPRALYNGYLITLMSGTPYVALQMSVYEALRRMVPVPSQVSEGHTIKRGEPPVLAKLACGSTAVIVAQTLTFPGDVLRRRMQSDGMAGRPKSYTGLRDAFLQIYRKEGWRAFFDGLKVNTWRCIPEGAIMFFTVDTMKNILNISQYDHK